MTDDRRIRRELPRTPARRAAVRIASDPRAGEDHMLAPPDTHAARRASRERARQRRIAQRNRNLRNVVIVLIAALVIGWTFTRQQSAKSNPAVADTPVVGEAQMVNGVGVSATNADPTPLFASYRSLHLYLPVPCAKLTEIGFHQASGDTALHLDSLLPDADMNAAFTNKGTGRKPEDAKDENGADALTGTVLRMWRSNRIGEPDSAVDVGAPPATPVFAPVTGTVTEVKPYKLYGEHDDVEIHIRPNGWNDVDVVLIHITDIAVREGDQVIGGCTQIATVRKLSDRVIPQISAYTSDPGDHVHMQLNRADVPGKLQPVGGS